ncbi:hypothetical protein [Glaesserella sp.]|uniref:hypothetical protein n=1 Tax=Glaesserella sp. TaxID=2094731 RepID=UPI0035A18AA3
MNKELQINELRKKTGVNDFSKLTLSEYTNIQKMLSEDKFDKQELSLLIELLPNLVDLQKDYIESVKEIAKQAGNAQASAFNAINCQMKVLEKLADNVETDEARIKIAEILSEMSKEVNKIIKEMNVDNNSLWKWIAAGAAAVVGIVGTILVSRRN